MGFSLEPLKALARNQGVSHVSQRHMEVFLRGEAQRCSDGDGYGLFPPQLGCKSFGMSTKKCRSFGKKLENLIRV